MKIQESPALCVNAPEFFKDAAFVAWLNNGEPKFTWHTKGEEVGEYADVVVLVDPSLNGEGSDSDMPEHIWNQIVEACHNEFKAKLRRPLSNTVHIMVRLTNIED